MFASIRKLTTVLGAAVAILAVSSTSYALPVFTGGSFALAVFTDTTTDVDLTTTFNLTSPVTTGSGVDDFATVPPPFILLNSASFDFVAGTGFDFNIAGFGAFTVSSTSTLPSPADGVTNATALGTFVPGALWANSGSNHTANMIWSATQTGGANEAISLSGTFHSPAISVPEPASMLLLSIGLAGAGLGLRRRQRARA